MLMPALNAHNQKPNILATSRPNPNMFDRKMYLKEKKKKRQNEEQFCLKKRHRLTINCGPPYDLRKGLTAPLVGGSFSRSALKSVQSSEQKSSWRPLEDPDRPSEAGRLKEPSLCSREHEQTEAGSRKDRVEGQRIVREVGGTF